jgi:hypothetical protein
MHGLSIQDSAAVHSGGLAFLTIMTSGGAIVLQGPGQGP